MTNHSPVKPSQQAIKDSADTWNNFVKASKIGGAGIGIILILMAIFLV